MKRVALISSVFSIAAVLFLSSHAFCAGQVKRYEVPSAFPEKLPGTALSVYLPDGYDTSRTFYPVLYLIHGDPGDELIWVGGGPGYPEWVKGWVNASNVRIIADRLIEEGKIKPLIVVCPNVSAVGSLEVDLISDVVSFVDNTFRTIPNRESRAIAGHIQSEDFDR